MWKHSARIGAAGDIHIFKVVDKNNLSGVKNHAQAVTLSNIQNSASFSIVSLDISSL
jgi:hypothetical protein